MPASQPSIRVTKVFTFRGSNHEWSNRYYFTGPAPSSDANWGTFSDLVVNAEKLALTAPSTIIKTQGYLAGSDVPVFTKTYALGGSLAATGFQMQQGEVAALVRYKTSEVSTKNHPRYLFNYYHGVRAVSSANPDSLESAQKTALETYAQAWVNGFTVATIVMVRCGPQGNVADSRIVDPNLTHRDFPRD